MQPKIGYLIFLEIPGGECIQFFSCTDSINKNWSNYWSIHIDQRVKNRADFESDALTFIDSYKNIVDGRQSAIVRDV